jgi:alpha-L-fucosidase
MKASQVRGDSRKYAGSRVVDGDPETYWTTDDGVHNASLILDFGKEITFNRFLAREYIPLGQRVKSFSLEAWVDGAWEEIDVQSTIGNKRILRFENVSSQKLRFSILDSRACPVISTVEVYHAPKLLEPPAIERDKQGNVYLRSFDSGLDIYYTTDGSEPSEASARFEESFAMKGKGEVRALAHDPATGTSSAVSTERFDICKEKWEVRAPDPRKDPRVQAVVDARANTIWRSNPEEGLPREVVVDLGELLTLKGFTYLPTQQRYIDGTISHYRLYLSTDGIQWGEPVSSGEFSNIRNSPVLQINEFDPVEARFLRFVAEREINDGEFVSIAELGVLTADQ